MSDSVDPLTDFEAGYCLSALIEAITYDETPYDANEWSREQVALKAIASGQHVVITAEELARLRALPPAAPTIPEELRRELQDLVDLMEGEADCCPKDAEWGAPMREWAGKIKAMLAAPTA